jgi:predicted amidohydrolase YtcJ
VSGVVGADAAAEHGGVREYALVNARVLTMDPASRVAEAVAVRDGRLVAVGDEASTLAAIDPSAPRHDLGGATVLPGFIDVHTHVEFITLSRHFWLDVRGVARDEVIERMQRRAALLPAGGWVVAQGTFGQDLPTKAELDAALPDRPAVARWTMHKFVVNEAALRVSGITASTPAPAGARIQLGDDGRPNGILEEAWDLLAIDGPTADELEPAMEETLGTLFTANGVTTVHEIACTRPGLRALRALASSGRAPRLGVLLTAGPGHQPLVSLSEDGVRALGPDLGDDRYWFQGIKIFMDGGRDGAFRSQQIDLPADRWGLLTRLYPTLVAELTNAVEAGLQVCTHAIGDLAQEIAVAAVERVHALHPDLDHRLRIEHFFNESFGTERLERLIAAGGIAVPNPGFVIAEPDDPARRQPEGATKYALRTLHALQGIVPGNSDTAGAQPFTTNPWFTMRCMLELRNRNGVPINDAERLDVDQALRSFTTDAAYATRQEAVKGSIEPGKLADLAIVDADPYAIPASEFDAVRTVATIRDGRVVHGALPGGGR